MLRAKRLDLVFVQTVSRQTKNKSRRAVKVKLYGTCTSCNLDEKWSGYRNPVSVDVNLDLLPLQISVFTLASFSSAQMDNKPNY